jgi:zinc-binding alcohol dehydrogenase/oxidoreductase
MRALRLHTVKVPLKVDEIPPPEAADGEDIVDIRYGALNRRDYFIQQGLYPRLRLPATLGSDGAGTCQGRPVIINPGLEWGDNERVQSPEFNILGMPRPGVFAEQVAVPSANIYPKPDHLTMPEAAALPLAGVTAYRALFVQGKGAPGEKLLITGIGGGVAVTALQMAVARGMEVSVTSSSNSKLERARALGAVHIANYTRKDWITGLINDAGKFDIVIDSAGGQSFGDLLRVVRPGGRMVVYGGTQGAVTHLSPQLIFWRQMTIQGSTMGSQEDFTQMLDFVNEHEIRPIVDSEFTLDAANDAFDRIRDSAQFGKVVLRI